MAEDETEPAGLEPGEKLVAWTAMPYRAPVMAASGALLGTAESLLGDEATGIFHGIVVKRDADGRMIEIPGDQVERVTTRRVQTTLTEEEAERLEPYEDKRWYQLDWGGLFRKRPDWVEPE